MRRSTIHLRNQQCAGSGRSQYKRLTADVPSSTEPADGSGLLHAHLPTSKVVKAVNHIYAAELTTQGSDLLRQPIPRRCSRPKSRSFSTRSRFSGVIEPACVRSGVEQAQCPGGSSTANSAIHGIPHQPELWHRRLLPRLAREPLPPSARHRRVLDMMLCPVRACLEHHSRDIAPRLGVARRR
jgi:hypothetical protein